MIDRLAMLGGLADALGPVTTEANDAAGTFALADRARVWLPECGAGGGPTPTDLDAVCRQIDVRRRLSAEYRPDWKRSEPEVPASAPVVHAVVGVLLAVATRGDDRGRDLKLVNSALKALDLVGDDGPVPALRAWAVELLDRATIGDRA